MNKRVVFKIIGIILCITGLFLLLPLTLSAADRSADLRPFLLSAALCALCGIPLLLLPTARLRLHTRDGYIAVALGWLALTLFSALPYLFFGAPFADAVFEAASGLTTTGASIFSDIESLPRGILLWRALTQWMGGMGVLVMALALLPKLGEGSINLMKAESPGPISSKLLPRTGDTAKVLYSIYIVLTLSQTILLRIAGMPLFDAVTTSLATISTGGFSVRNTSIAYYGSEAINWIVILFMLVSSINFSLLYLAVKRRFREALRSEELRSYLVIVLLASLGITLTLCCKTGRNAYCSFSAAVFQVVSLISTTGFCTEDFDLWPHFCRSIILIVMCIGGCAGSTSGGIKVSRILILWKNTRRELRRILHTREVRPICLDGVRVEENTLTSVSAFLYCYFFIILAAAALVSLDEVDLTTSLSAALTSISNVGPGLSLVGPTCNFSFFSPLSKLVLAFTMLLGRLEIIPLLVVFLPAMWHGKKR